MKIAFDIDDTIWKVRTEKPFGQVPDYNLILVLKWFYDNGDTVYVWSAGGVNYAQQIVEKLGLEGMVTVIPKGELNTPHPDNPKIDIAFDDCETNLATVDVKVRRKHINNK